MKEFFSIEGPFMQFFGKLWDIILLSIVFCVCSIPIITFGMNCIALYYTVVKVVLPGERHAVRTFLRMVPRNARQGLPLGILFEIIIAVLAYSLIVVLHNDMGALGVFFGVVFVMLFMHFRCLHVLKIRSERLLLTVLLWHWNTGKRQPPC